MQPPLPVAMAAVAVCLLLAALAAFSAFGVWPAAMLQRVHRSVNAPAVPLAPPPVEPVALEPLPRDAAIAANAAVPFSTAPNPAARPFLLDAAGVDRSRAIDCLAAAGYYEAGDDTEGQRAVVQVVLNRLRHPAFPKTVCDVVFQGSERTTGCQFTFTCDGALARTPPAAAWERARAVAAAALDGGVYRPVGLATHYHTDWVIPHWSASLEKITAVRTHLFFRWPGEWGRPRAYGGMHAGHEPPVSLIARLADAHRAGVDAMVATSTPPPVDAVISAPPPMPVAEVIAQDAEGLVILIDAGAAADSLVALAASLCGMRNVCKVRAWTDRASAPSTLPVEPARLAAMAFSYMRNHSQRFERPQWNCTRFARANPRECLKIPFNARLHRAPPPTPPKPTIADAPAQLARTE